VKILRANAIPFWNPYRKTNGAWNPIHITGAGRRPAGSCRCWQPTRTTAPIIVLDHGDLQAWAECLASKGVLQHGAKKKLAQHDADEPVTLTSLMGLFEPAALDSLMEAYDGDYRTLLEWWRSRASAEYFERLKYPVEVAKQRGPGALLEQPHAIVGTVHSVKGGEADVVYLFPDLSQAGAAQYMRAGPRGIP